MNRLFLAVCVASLCAGCSQPAQKEVANAKTKIKDPAPKAVDAQPAKPKELPQQELESTVGSFWVTLPRAWIGTDLTDTAIEAFVQRISRVDAKVGSNVRKQATELKAASGTLLAFDARPSRIKYGFGDFLIGSKSEKTQAKLDDLLKSAKQFASETPSEKTFNTPHGKTRWIRCVQFAKAPSGVQFNVAHHFYIIERPKAYYAFKCSTLVEREAEVSKEFQAMIESLAFSD